MERYVCQIPGCSNESKVICTSHENLVGYCKVHIFVHLKDNENHIVATTPDSCQNSIIKFVFPIDITLQVLIDENKVKTILDLKKVLGQVIGVHKNFLVFRFNHFVLLDNFKLNVYKIFNNTEILVQILWNSFYWVFKQKASKAISEFFSNTDIKKCELYYSWLSKLSLLSEDNKTEFIQFGGDLEILKVFSLSGFFLSCTYVGENPSNILQYEKTLLYSRVAFRDKIPSNTNFKVLFFYDEASFKQIEEFLDIENNLVFINDLPEYYSKYIYLDGYRNHSLTLIKPIKMCENYIFVSDLIKKIKSFSETEPDYVIRIKKMKLIIDEVTENIESHLQFSLNLKKLVSEQISLKIIEEVNQMHQILCQFEYDKYCLLQSFLNLNKLVCLRYFVQLKEEDKFFNISKFNEEELELGYDELPENFSEINSKKTEIIHNFFTFNNKNPFEPFERMILEIFHRGPVCSLGATLMSNVFIDYANLKYVFEVFSSEVRIFNIKPIITELLKTTYWENLNKNFSYLKRIYILDHYDNEDFIENTQIIELENDLNTIFKINPKHFINQEFNSLCDLIPNEVISIPSNINLSGKTLLGAKIGISQTILSTYELHRVSFIRFIYVLRHEISHKKWLLRERNKNYLIRSPEVVYDSFTKEESGLFTDMVLYGNFNPHFLPEWDKADENILNCIEQGTRLSQDQLKTFYRPEIRGSKKNMDSDYDNFFKVEILCNGRGTLYYCNF